MSIYLAPKEMNGVKEAISKDSIDFTTINLMRYILAYSLSGSYSCKFQKVMCSVFVRIFMVTVIKEVITGTVISGTFGINLYFHSLRIIFNYLL